VSHPSVEALEEAWDATSDLLIPFDRGTWLRLAVLVIFTGMGMSFPNFPTGGFSGDSGEFSRTGASADTNLQQAVETSLSGSAPTSLATGATPGVLAIGFSILAFLIVLFIISSILELVYYRSLLDGEVRIRSNFNAHRNSGGRYFAFRVGTALVSVALAAATTATFLLNPIIGIFGALFGLVVLVAMAVFLGLTNNFVVPYMVENGGGPLDAWREMWDTFREEAREIALYIVVRFVVRAVGGLLSLIWVVFLVILLGLLFGIPTYFLAQASVIAAAVLVIVAFVLFVAGVLAAAIPIQTFTYYHALKVYQKLF
jgi:hypothetical protein